MGLQIRRTGADEYGTFVKALFCGNPGAGKTLTCSTWPNVLYASAEGGLMSVADRHVPYTDITTSQELLALRNSLDQAPEVRERLLGVPVDTVVVDTIDTIQKILIEERKATQRKEAMAIQDFGWLGDQMRGIVRGFRNLPVHVVMTCHIKKDSDPETGNLIYGPALQGQIGDEIAQYFDIVALLRGEVVTRVVGNESKKVQIKVMQTYPDAKHPWIKDRSGKLPAELELDFEEDFPKIHKAIFGEIASVGASADIHEVANDEVAALRQARIEENLAPTTAGTPPEPPAKAAATKKAATKKAATTKKAAPKADAAPKKDEPKDEPPKDEAPKAEEKAPQEAAEKAEGEPEAETPPAEPEAPEAPAEEPEQAEEQQQEMAPEGVDPATGEITGDGDDGEQQDSTEGNEETSEADSETTDAEAPYGRCEECGDPIESDDVADLARLRHRKALDRKCFKAAKDKEKEAKQTVSA